MSTVGTRAIELVTKDGASFVSAGRRGLQLELAPADLVRLSHAISVSISRDQGQG